MERKEIHLFPQKLMGSHHILLNQISHISVPRKSLLSPTRIHMKELSERIPDLSVNIRYGYIRVYEWKRYSWDKFPGTLIWWECVKDNQQCKQLVIGRDPQYDSSLTKKKGGMSKHIQGSVSASRRWWEILPLLISYGMWKNRRMLVQCQHIKLF